MPPRFDKVHSEQSSLPLGKILIATTLAIGAISLGFHWWASIEAEKEAEKLYIAAKDHFRNQQYQEGLIKIKKALQTKEKVDYLETEANILLNQNKHSEALDALERMTVLDPKKAHFHYWAGNIAFQEENLEKAIQHMQAAVKLSPDTLDYQITLGNLYRHDNEAEKADQVFEGILKKDPKAINALNQYVMGNINTGHTDKALSHLRSLKSHYTHNSDYYFLLAQALDANHQEKEAAATYRHSLELEPKQDSISAKRFFEITGQRVPPALEKLTKNQIPYTGDGRLMFVDASINGVPGHFLFDTGASISLVHAKSRDKFHLAESSQTTTVEGVNGRSLMHYAYGDLQLGQHISHDVSFVISNTPSSLQADGIIGMDFLENFRFEIDRPSHRITLSR